MTLSKFAFVIALALSSTSLFAMGGNEGPVGVPVTPAPGTRVIATKFENSGTVAPTYQREMGIRIYSSGEVTQYIKHLYPTAGDGEKYVTQLDAVSLHKLEAEIDSIRDLQLIDLDAGKPICIGGGSIHYAITKSGEAAFANIEVQAGCHKSILKNNDGSRIVNYLDKLEEMANAQPQAAALR